MSYILLPPPPLYIHAELRGIPEGVLGGVVGGVVVLLLIILLLLVVLIPVAIKRTRTNTIHHSQGDGAEYGSVYTHACTHTYMQRHAQTCMHVYMQRHAQTCMHVYTHGFNFNFSLLNELASYMYVCTQIIMCSYKTILTKPFSTLFTLHSCIRCNRCFPDYSVLCSRRQSCIRDT